jgi:phosphoglycerol transferase MdoB-like AlkP superfamily enzyme
MENAILGRSGAGDGSWVRWGLARRHGGVGLFIGLFMAVAMVTRVALLVKSAGAVDWNLTMVKALGWGVLFDLGAALLFAAPLTIVLTALPARIFERRWARGVAHGFFVVAVAGLLFGVVAEWLFWDEFSTRFNFIAVDYLVYTTEVIANIRESYPMPAIFGGLGLVSAGGYLLFLRTGWVDVWLRAPHEPARRRWLAGAGWLGVTVLAGLVLDSKQLPNFPNTYNREIAKNGVWSLFAAFRNNELDYDQFYSVLPVDEAFKIIRSKLARDGSQMLPVVDGRDTLRYVTAPIVGPELRLNVIQITVESLSASFLSSFNKATRLMPNMEALAKESLVFENFYASGTRTDRGMEALTLGIPPTPGRSLVKRPRNADLFTLGSVFRSHGYDTAFIYGGYGYFDNMNAFFGGNGYRVVDRGSVAKTDITFANAWGACDGDLYNWTLREADAEVAKGKPFHFFVMTTSNHRPFTYPDGKIDLPSKISGRSGAVKYTDYAIGEFIHQASAKPWFKNTVFVIVADHCASVAGKSELPVQSYHIPLFIYAPGGQIAPGRVTDLMAQVDYPPTLLGLLDWSYATRFYGWDVRHAAAGRRALIGNYQKLGLYQDGMLDVLSPVRAHRAYAFDMESFGLTRTLADPERRSEAIAYYQTASYLYKHDLYKAITAEQQVAYAAAIHTQLMHTR